MVQTSEVAQECAPSCPKITLHPIPQFLIPQIQNAEHKIRNQKLWKWMWNGG